MSHTPGPWGIESDPFWVDKTCVYNVIAAPPPGYDDDVCPAKAYGRNVEEAKANARLIAAAPELLAACKEAVRVKRIWKNHDLSYRQCLAAIVKAEGKQDETAT
ncbi:MAG: hypothetical protein ACYTA5_21760 [Planctomycetota bacterium]|jgi:hypothetical protein